MDSPGFMGMISAKKGTELFNKVKISSIDYDYQSYCREKIIQDKHSDVQELSWTVDKQELCKNLKLEQKKDI